MTEQDVAVRIDRAVGAAFEVFAECIKEGRQPQGAAEEVGAAFHGQADEREDLVERIMPKGYTRPWRGLPKGSVPMALYDGQMRVHLDLIRELHHAAVDNPEIMRFMAARAELYGPTETSKADAAGG